MFSYNPRELQIAGTEQDNAALGGGKKGAKCSLCNSTVTAITHFHDQRIYKTIQTAAPSNARDAIKENKG